MSSRRKTTTPEPITVHQISISFKYEGNPFDFMETVELRTELRDLFEAALQRRCEKRGVQNKIYSLGIGHIRFLKETPETNMKYDVSISFTLMRTLKGGDYMKDYVRARTKVTASDAANAVQVAIDETREHYRGIQGSHDFILLEANAEPEKRVMS